MKKECIAMLLAGGEGKRLGVLTKNLAKPAVPFGGKYRIIDFALSNCTNSGIDTVGILTQYQPLVLHGYIGAGKNWALNCKHGGAIVLPPFVEQKGGKWYNGTANAVYQNLYYIEQYAPEYVLIISGDHIYKMDYSIMLNYHKAKNADVTIGVVNVPWEEASRFGTVLTQEDGKIIGFEEKPKHPKSNLVSMGIYIFNWNILKSYLARDEQDTDSSHDFGKDVIPLILRENNQLFAYYFDGYWKDVGTIASLWKANMDLLSHDDKLNLYDENWKIYSVCSNLPPQYIAATAKVERSMISTGCMVLGEVKNSVLFSGVHIGENSLIQDSVIMSNAKIGSNVTISRSIIGSGTVIDDGCKVGSSEKNVEITVVGDNKLLYSNVIAQTKLMQSV